MNEAQIIAYAIQGIQLAIRAVAAGSQAHTILSQTDDALRAMQADGNRGPTDEERAAQLVLLESLAALPPQG